MIFISAYDQGNTDISRWRFGSHSSSVLDSSAFVYRNSSDPTSTDTVWTNFSGFGDLAFKLYFGYTATLHSEWVQPYAAMQNVGLKSIDNNRDLVLAKAGECNNYGWVIGDTDYCVYTNIKNKVSYVNGDTTRGSYGSAVFNGSINVEKTINDKWKAGVAYGTVSYTHLRAHET